MILGPRAIADLPPIPWKNGGGVTRTLAQEPEQAGMNDFLWRVSVAELQSAGSFSVFPGIDRIIHLWSGTGLLLRSPEWPDRILSADAEPFAFRGESNVSCELIGGPSQDLNLMARRGSVTAAMKAGAGRCRVSHVCHDLLLLCSHGSLRLVLNDKAAVTLEAGKFLHASNLQQEAIIEPNDQATRFVYITIQY